MSYLNEMECEASINTDAEEVNQIVSNFFNEDSQRLKAGEKSPENNADQSN